MGFLKDRIWSWGYVLNSVPGAAPFTSGRSRCSLETQAAYLGAERCFYMNSMFDRKYVETCFGKWDGEVIPNCVDQRLSDEHLRRLGKMKKVFCTLEHENYLESALKIARASLVFRNICGVHFDDFAPWKGGELIEEIRDRIRAINPELQIAAVTYSHWDWEKTYAAAAPFIDVFSRWCWVASLDYWDICRDEILKLRDLAGEGKKIFHGIYIHDFGSGRPIPDCRNCVPMEVFRKSVETVCEQTCSGILDGIILPQAAYFSFPSHREHVKFLKEYVDWADGTMTEL